MRFLAGLAVVCALHAQDTAALTGLVLDPLRAGVPGARVRVEDPSRNFRREAVSGETGVYLVDALPPGEYSVTVEKTGFSRLTIERVLLKTRDRQTLNLELEVAALKDSVTVTEVVEGLSTDSSAGVTVEQDYLRHLPVNERTVEALARMAPGVTTAAGGLNANGLRANTNYYMLDGVSAGGGMMGGGAGGMGGPMMGGPMRGGGGPPGGGGMMGGPGGGGMGAGVSLDSLSEVRIQTSTFAPEYGRTPGAQVSMASRGGSNAWHGSGYGYLRDRRFNANEWFANREGYPRGEMRVRQYGASLGGPALPSRVFFFANVEGARNLSPATVLADVPDDNIRLTAASALRPYLNAFPRANGAAVDENIARFSTVISNPSRRDTGSLRLDGAINAENTLFVRYGYGKSTSTSRGSEFITPNVVSSSASTDHSLTAGWTSTPRAGLSSDFRMSLTTMPMHGAGYMDGFGGATPLAASAVYPAGITADTGTFSLSVLGLSAYSLNNWSRNTSYSMNLVEGLTMVAGSHQYKVGADYRVSTSTQRNIPYSLSVVFDGLSEDEGALLSGVSTSAMVSSSVPATYPMTVNFSAYLQDTWRVTERTTVTYGMRWDVNPAPTARKGPRPFALSSSSSGNVTQNEPIYDTRWSDLAPRIGFTHQLGGDPGRELVVRGGVGAFHDLGYGQTSGAFRGAPYSAVNTYSKKAFPLAEEYWAAPTLPPTTPYGQISAAERALQSPLVYQINVTLEKSFGRGQVVSAGYVSTRGSRLLRTSMTPSYTSQYDMLTLATNGASSKYHGLQAQYSRRLSRRFQAQVSYTWGHALDSASSDVGGGFATLFGSEMGNSDYDVRHTLSATGSYLFPAPRMTVLRLMLKDWYADYSFTSRTSLPFEVVGVSSTTSDASSSNRGLFAQVRPNYVYGEEIWIDDGNAPGGRRLNRNAFELPSGYKQGNLGRNVLRGFGLAQVDLSLRRRLVLTERINLHLALQAFNALNRASFANPSRNEGANLSSAEFGVATRTVFGGAGGLYGSGGPRSLQFTARLQF